MKRLIGIIAIICRIFLRNSDLDKCYAVYQDISKDIPVCTFTKQKEDFFVVWSTQNLYNQIAIQIIKQCKSILAWFC